MKEQFDKKLVEKIKDSFDQNLEPFDPKEWDKFSKAYFRPNRKPVWVYWPVWVSGIAASLLLVFVLWPVADQIEDKVQSLADTLSVDSGKFEVLLPADSAKEGMETFPEALVFEDKKTLTPEKSQKTSASRELDPSSSRQAGLLALDRTTTSMADVPLSGVSSASPVLEIATELPYPDISLDAPVGDLAQSLMVQKETDAQAWIDRWKNGDQLKEKEIETQSGKNPVRLGLMVSPQAASTAVSGMNFGAGIMSEFSFSKRLKLDVGLNYARQNLVANDFVAVGRNLNVNVPSGQNLPTADASFSGQSAAVYRSSSLTNNLINSNYELNFANLDIPVNLKYKVMDKANSGLFVMTGLSSMIYLSQNTVGTFSTNTFALSAQEASAGFSQIEQFSAEFTPTDGQNNVDLGRMLNLSVGYEYNLKNGTFLSIEPFYKMPMGNMTFAEQQFSIGGINLRMNFQLKK